ncbi:MAG: phosphonopyruvate decarboxylase [Bacilli bacterium]
MIDTKSFYDYLLKSGVDAFYGVPDSLLKDICAYITKNAPSEKHIITANEGNAVALACGHYLATGKPALVYLQNSGLGNIVNPLISLADEDVYNIPVLFMIGWRGEPGTKDEPQHKKQGKITLSTLETLGVKTIVIDDNFESAIDEAMLFMKKTLKSVALVIKKDTFSKVKLALPRDQFLMTREEALGVVMNQIDEKSVIVSTTGKTSREVFEIRQKAGQTHEKDFLTVGSMGHASSIALGISLANRKKVYCVDGDGAMLMHLGGLGVAAMNAPKNFKYIVINNGAHESVGGQPTIALALNNKKILEGLGFSKVYEAKSIQDVKEMFPKFNRKAKAAFVIYVNQGSRDDLGRPTTTPVENKEALMKFLRKTRK